MLLSHENNLTLVLFIFILKNGQSVEMSALTQNFNKFVWKDVTVTHLTKTSKCLTLAMNYEQ